MPIRINSGFSVGAPLPIDTRFNLTYEQMLNIDDNIMPQVYFTVCVEDGFIYVYNKNNAPTALTGKFVKQEGGSLPTGSAYEITHSSGTYKLVNDLYKYKLLLQQSEDSLLPTTIDDTINPNKTITTEIFNPFGKIYYYNSTSTVYKNGSVNVNTLFDQVVFDLRYSFNCGTTLIANKDVFIVAVPLNNGFAQLYDQPLSQLLPNSENNLIYIYLGHSCSANLVEISFEHPIFWFKQNKLQLYTGMTDTTYGIATTSSSGLLPQLDGDPAKFFRGDGLFASPDSLLNSDLDEICT